MSKKVMVLTYPGCQALDVAGPVDALLMTNEVSQDRGGDPLCYDIKVVAPQRGALGTHGGVLRLHVDQAISEITDEELAELDIFMIAGGFSAVSLRDEPNVVAFIQRASRHAKRLASVCTSAFLFAEAGVLDGHTVTTHWRVADRLAHDYPTIKVDADALVCHDGKVWSSGGISAGVDLALAIVENDLGADIARSVARMMVMFLARPGGQAQFQSPVADAMDLAPPTDLQIQGIIDLIRLHPAKDLRRSTLAEQFNLTERTLARRFQSFTGMTIARFVEDVRLGHARLHLEDSEMTMEKVAERAGFNSADSMRRVFIKRLSISPHNYRARFKSTIRSRSDNGPLLSSMS
jgi:transcriptional regulator GlxA family with amidase domain